MPRRELDEWMLQVAADFQRHTGSTRNLRGGFTQQREWAPRVDLLEAETHFILRVELAGVDPGQVAIQFDPKRHTLVVKGERADGLCGRKERYNPLQLEIETGAFTREVPLPHVLVDVRNAQASWTNGLLQVVVPKETYLDEVEVRHITIQRLK